jgi:hypothetical protein
MRISLFLSEVSSPQQEVLIHTDFLIFTNSSTVIRAMPIWTYKGKLMEWTHPFITGFIWAMMVSGFCCRNGW